VPNLVVKVNPQPCRIAIEEPLIPRLQPRHRYEATYTCSPHSFIHHATFWGRMEICGPGQLRVPLVGGLCDEGSPA